MSNVFWWRCLCKHNWHFPLVAFCCVVFDIFVSILTVLICYPFNVFSMYYKLTSDWNPSHFLKCQNNDVGHQNQLSHVFNSVPLFYSLPLTLMWHGELLQLPYFVGIISASSPSLSISLVWEIFCYSIIVRFFNIFVLKLYSFITCTLRFELFQSFSKS